MPPRVVCDYPCEIGENPLWHPDEGCLYWTDIPRGRLFRYFPATGKHEQVYQGRVVGGFTLQALDANGVPFANSYAARAGSRRHQRQAFSSERIGRARMGSPRNQRSSSSANSWADA